MPKNRSLNTIAPVWVSQNFLTSAKTIQRLINRTSLNKNDQVIEIGPGKGHITSALVRRCRSVTAVEIDEKLYSRLKEKFNGVENLSLWHQNFLKWRLPVSENYKVFSNIPFCITTDILRRLTECRNPPEEAWLVMEKGAAKRFMGKPRETLRSLLLKPLYDMDITYYFRRDDFHPRPSVDTVLFHIRKKKQPDISKVQLKKYKRFVTGCMSARGLRGVFTKKQLCRALREAGINESVTSGEILYIQWLCLFRCYCSHVPDVN